VKREPFSLAVSDALTRLAPGESPTASQSESSPLRCPRTCAPSRACLAQNVNSCNHCRVKNRRELNASLSGATLGDADAAVDDTRAWLRRSKKQEKVLAQRRQRELESMDKQFQDQYTERAWADCVCRRAGAGLTLVQATSRA
jgi:hypothetical protein